MTGPVSFPTIYVLGAAHLLCRLAEICIVLLLPFRSIMRWSRRTHYLVIHVQWLISQGARDGIRWDNG